MSVSSARFPQTLLTSICKTSCLPGRMAHEDDDNDNDWNGWDEEDAGDSAKCLFCDKIVQSTKLTLAHVKSDHGFDFDAVRSQLKLDFYGCMRLINFIRSENAAGTSVQGITDKVMAKGSWMSDEKYLIPVLQEDALLFDLDGDEEDFDDAEDMTAPTNQPSEDIKAENEYLKEKLAVLVETVEKMKQAFGTLSNSEAAMNDSDSDSDSDAEEKKVAPKDAESATEGQDAKYSNRNKKGGLKAPHDAVGSSVRTFRALAYILPSIYTSSVTNASMPRSNRGTSKTTATGKSTKLCSKTR